MKDSDATAKFCVGVFVSTKAMSQPDCFLSLEPTCNDFISGLNDVMVSSKNDEIRNIHIAFYLPLLHLLNLVHLCLSDWHK